MVLYKKLVPSIFFRSIPSRSSLSFSRISILFLSPSQSEIWTVDGFERYRVDKKDWDLSSLSYTQPFKGKKVTRKKKQGDLDCTFRGGWYSSWAQISWSWSADVKCFKQIWNCTHFRHPTDEQLHNRYFLATTIICSLSTLNWYVPGLAVVGNLSNTDKRRWGQGTFVPAHSVLDLKGKKQLCLFTLVFSEWCFLQRETFPK